VPALEAVASRRASLRLSAPASPSVVRWLAGLAPVPGQPYMSDSPVWPSRSRSAGSSAYGDSKMILVLRSGSSSPRMPAPIAAATARACRGAAGCSASAAACLRCRARACRSAARRRLRMVVASLPSTSAARVAALARRAVPCRRPTSRSQSRPRSPARTDQHGEAPARGSGRPQTSSPGCAARS
jgi:hypothetical protein